MIRAILAGGLVLGVGAAVTLAAWNDSENVTGTFTTGAFDLQGSFDGTTWASHTAPGTPLTFVATPSAMSPGDVTYAPFAVRLAPNTTNDATITITSSTTDPLTGLSYQLFQPTGTTFGCSAASTVGTSFVGPAAVMGAVTPGTATFTLSKGAPVTSAGAVVNLCFKVTATTTQANLTQGHTGTVTWIFTAASLP